MELAGKDDSQSYLMNNFLHCIRINRIVCKRLIVLMNK